MPNLSSHRQSPTLIALGGAIRRTRLEKGMSQEELSLRAEVDLSYVGRVERGDNNVAIMTLQKIASALEISMSALLELADL
ncbi:helix-turn-helix domain-containing protein [Herbaspirillum seropedicae]|uniref:helix-turn-helix domain-containing protein n=1 Tax=Herbaspirillum seropedicae TaxID=964 RepID=UPI00339B9893